MIREVVTFILIALLCYYISAIIHELGHIFVGVLQGFKFFLLVVGPIGFKRNENDRIVIYLEKNPALWGGVGGVLPSDEKIDNFDKFGRVLLGGPIVSIIFGLLFLPMAISTKMMFFLLLSMMPIGMGIACLIPMRNGAFHSDGGRWIRMKKADTRKIELAIWNIVQKAGFKEEYTNIDIEDVETLINDEDVRSKYMGHYFAYLYYKGKEDILRIEQEKRMVKELELKVSKQFSVLYPVK